MYVIITVSNLITNKFSVNFLIPMSSKFCTIYIIPKVNWQHGLLTKANFKIGFTTLTICSKKLMKNNYCNIYTRPSHYDLEVLNPVADVL